MSERFGLETVSGVSEAFDLLRNPRRRGVLYAVRDGGRTSVGELAHCIAAWQSDDGSAGPDPKTVETSLVHSHLPKLDDAGALEYDREDGVVEPTEATDDFDPFLDRTSEQEPELFSDTHASNRESAFEN